MFAPGGEPVLWPEHFDVAVDLDEVTYGVSLGDAEIAGPYAYVAPWARPAGSGTPVSAHPLGQPPRPELIAEFFQADRSAAG